MADYQLSHLSLSTRFALASLMLAPFRPWGMVSELSRAHGVSRKFLYELQEKARVSILGALQPGEPGRHTNSSQIEIDAHFVRRAIAVCMSVMPGTVRTVQTVLELLLGIRCSSGYISQVAQEHRDKTTWGCLLLDVQKQGVHLVDVASDGALGIRAGVQEVSLSIPLRPDLFHLIRDAHRVRQRLENALTRRLHWPNEPEKPSKSEKCPSVARVHPSK